MEPIKPMAGGEKWWSEALGEPTTSGSQNDLHYAFFAEARRLLLHRDGKVTTYYTGTHRISGVTQHGSSHAPTFSSADGDVVLSELEQLR